MAIIIDSNGNEPQTVEVSVIIPAYNAEETIDACLDSLHSQTLSPDIYEVIVVDNGSTDDTPQRIKRHNVTYLRAPDCTVYAARNKAVSVAKAGSIAFIDSDCVADRRWLESGIENLKRYHIVAGHIDVLQSSRKWLYAYDKYILRNPLRKQNKEVNIAAGNAFVRKEVFEAVGGFREDISTASDSIFSMVARSMKYEIGYVPSAVVYHPVDGWGNKLRRYFFRESYGSELKDQYLSAERKQLTSRLSNVKIGIQQDLRNLHLGWSRNEIKLSMVIGITVILLLLRIFEYSSIIIARSLSKFYR